MATACAATAFGTAYKANEEYTGEGCPPAFCANSYCINSYVFSGVGSLFLGTEQYFKQSNLTERKADVSSKLAKLGVFRERMIGRIAVERAVVAAQQPAPVVQTTPAVQDLKI